VDRGLVLTGPREFGLEELEVGEPGPGEVRIRVVATGVCHSDLHEAEEPSVERLPMLLGHEGAGVIESVGEGVDETRVGERVVVAWTAPCGECRACSHGEPRRCERPLRARRRIKRGNGELVSQFLLSGAYSTRTIVNSAQAVRVPDELPLEHACLLSCGVVTGVGSVLNTAAVWPGATVAVIGCGGVGISVVQGARLAGAGRVLAVDLDERKREAARRFGASQTAAGLDEEADFVFDVVGRPETLRAAVESVGWGGTVVLVGIPRRGSTVELELRELFDTRTRIVVSHGGDNLPAVDIPLLADRAITGDLDLAGMVTREIRLEEVADALRELPQSTGVRTVVRLEARQ
jgi:S-(hydroxymethyl)mycothiol dehydrogenase